MEKSNTTGAATDTGQELLISRTLHAPRDLVWKEWTEPERVKRWWGPKDFTAPVVQIDFREGGKYLYCMRSPEGRDYWSTGVFREIVPPERIVLTDSFADEQGNVVPATHYGMSADFPLESLVTITFEDHWTQTGITLRYSGIPSGEDLDNAREGWNQTLDKLEDDLQEQKNADPNQPFVVGGSCD